MSGMSEIVILGIVLALIFDFINGFHDAANSIATIVSTRVLSPQLAVLWAAFFNFVAFLFFELKVATTIGKGIINPAVVDPQFIVAALIGAIVWNMITWYFGLPSSSSHALIGALAGTALVKSGAGDLELFGIAKILVSIVASPLLGLLLGRALMKLSLLVVANKPPRKVNTWFSRLQFVSAALYSLGHGGNDAQKTMGVIAVLLLSAGHLGGDFHVPLWVVLSCQAAMALGTMCGGWRIVKTMGMKLTELRPIGGFAAETGGAATLFLATGLGVPVSTTHTITGAIVGVGSATALKKIDWLAARRILWAWVFTVPVSGGIAALIWLALQMV